MAKKGAQAEQKLTFKEKSFCHEFLKDLNATQAAIRAEYSKRSARQMAARLLSKDYIQAEISKLIDAREKRTEITVDRVLNELGLIGFSDIANYVKVSDDGVVTVNDLTTLKEGLSRVIKKIKQKTVYRTSPDGEKELEDNYTEIELCDKLGALTKIGEHLKMFVNRLEHSGKIALERPSVDDFKAAMETSESD